MSSSFSKLDEIFITVSRSDVNRDCDRIEVSVPIVRKSYSEGYGTITSDLFGIAYMPSKTSWRNGEASWVDGPKTFDVEIRPQGGYGSVSLEDLDADLKAARKIMKRFDAQVVRPKTFGEQVALLAHAAKLPVRLFRAGPDFDATHAYARNDMATFSADAGGLASLRSFLDGRIAALVAKRRIELGIDPKPVVNIEGDPVEQEVS